MRDDSAPGGTGVQATRPASLLPAPGDLEAPGPGPVAAADGLAAAERQQGAARALLAEAHDEAQSLVRDAADQAMLVAAAAEQAAESVLAEARAEAEQERAQAQLTATAFRAQAEQILLGAQREADQRHADLAADLTRSWNEHERELRELFAVAQAEALEVRTAADQHAATMLEETQRQAALLLSIAQDRLDQAERDSAASRLAAAEQAAALREQARQEAARELAAAAEQTAWAQQVVTGLVDTATLEAGRIRGRAHAEATATVRQARLRVSAVLASATQKLRQRRGELEHELLAAAQGRERQLAEAAAESAAVLARARQQAETILARAEEAVAGHHDRAERRLAEAEAGARAVREQVAEQVGQSHREMYESRRAAKAEAGALVGDARAEAEDLRAQAHQQLAEVRAEVALLTDRRDAIAAELGQLSGVIEALSDPDGARAMGGPASAFRPLATEVDHSVVIDSPPVQTWLITHDLGPQPVGPRTDPHDLEDVDGTFLLDQMMRAADDPEQQRSVPDGNAWLRTRRGRSTAG
ncbi:hypothetical protein [Jatrophihabitans sp.]|uniref:hypothetical protein n=1 Tax=Jatrophihabitans sp. TaxID=1932789 RepID=UPI002EED2BC9